MVAAVGAAAFFRQNGMKKQVTVLEKMPRPGRKIMITGKGRCNFTNMKDWNDFSGHIHPKSTLLKPAYFTLPPAKTVEWLEEAGLDSIVERGDRVFPASYRSSDVVDTLQRTLKQAGACLLTGYEADRISMRNDEEEGDYYMVHCSSGAIFTGRRLIIATGGLSYPSTGSTGDGYRWASETGHKINRCFPSLTAIVPKSYKSVPQGALTGETDDMLPGHIDRSVPLSETGSLLNGNSLENVSLTLWIDGNPVQEEFGDMDFTDGGIEGPIGFRISRRCVNAIINDQKYKGLYMFLADDLVLAHSAIENGVHHVDVSLCTFKKPVRFLNGNYARIILVLAAEDQTKHIRILNDVLDIFSKKKSIDQIVDLDSPLEISHYIATHID